MKQSLSGARSPGTHDPSILGNPSKLWPSVGRESAESDTIARSDEASTEVASTLASALASELSVTTVVESDRPSSLASTVPPSTGGSVGALVEHAQVAIEGMKSATPKKRRRCREIPIP